LKVRNVTFSQKIGAAGLCLTCCARLVPEPQWGAWTWHYGTCADCDHFGVVTEPEYPRAAAERLTLDKQGELGF
jgi:hypothetical protein